MLYSKPGEYKKNKGIQVGKENVELSLFSINMILFVEKLIESIKQTNKQTDPQPKVIRQSILLVYTVDQPWEVEIKVKNIYNSIKNIKYLGTNSATHVQDFCTGNYNPLAREITENLDKWRDSINMGPDYKSIYENAKDLRINKTTFFFKKRTTLRD